MADHDRVAMKCVVTVGGKAQGFPKCNEDAVGKATEPPYWPLCAEHFTFAVIAGWKPQYWDDLDHPQPGDPDSMTVPCPACGRPCTFGDSDDMTVTCGCGKSVFLDAYDCHYRVEASDCEHEEVAS